ncbi:MAG: hypothetical protein WC389_15945 [Lutibacter sp.]|jgi:hypothetical protein
MKNILFLLMLFVSFVLLTPAIGYSKEKGTKIENAKDVQIESIAVEQEATCFDIGLINNDNPYILNVLTVSDKMLKGDLILSSLEGKYLNRYKTSNKYKRLGNYQKNYIRLCALKLSIKTV